MAVVKRLGYILEKTGLLEKHNALFKDIRLSKGYVALDTLAPRKGRYNSRWTLLVNKEIKPEGWIY